MLRFYLICLLFSSAFLFRTGPAWAALNVMTTTPDLAAIARAVGGERVSVRSLSLPTQDPHWVDAKPSLALDLSHADLLVVVGAELELGWLPSLQLGSRNGRIQRGARGFLDCSELVNLLDRPAGKVDRSQGDIHSTGNPHYLLDPRAGERVAVGIGKRLAELDPKGAAAYLEQTKRFVTSLQESQLRWQKQLERVRGRRVVAYHRSLAYLANFAGIEVIDHVESKPGVPPAPRHVAELIALAQQKGVEVVLQEQWYPTGTSALIAKKLRGQLVRLPGATNFQGGQSYMGFIDQLVKTLAEKL